MTRFTKCKKCGECCVDILLTKKELSMFKFLLKTMGRTSIDHRVEEDNRRGLPYKLLGICPFLSKEKRCQIYTFKPHICDIFPVTVTDNCIGIRQDNSKEE